MGKIDLVYLKKRSAMTTEFDDAKVSAALAKITPPPVDISNIAAAKVENFDCIVPNKAFRNWIDLIPESDRGFVRFIYTDGDEKDVLKYMQAAMTKPAFADFLVKISMPATEDDLFLMRWLIWHGVVLKRPVGFDFGNYEMNSIFNSLPLDVSKDKIKFDRGPTFSDFYKMIAFAEWGCQNAY